VPLLATALGLSLLGSCGGLLVASSLLLFTQRIRTRLVPWLVSYAVGALLGVALLALLPEALETLSPPAVFGTLLAGILTFFVLEKLVLLRHCHTDACQVHGATVPLVLVGDAFHNFIDGAIICAAVLTSVPLGVNTAIAVKPGFFQSICKPYRRSCQKVFMSASSVLDHSYRSATNGSTFVARRAGM
jgi:zinc and cadmium transporter